MTKKSFESANAYNQIYFPSVKILDSTAPKMKNIDRLYQYYIKPSDESTRVSKNHPKNLNFTSKSPNSNSLFQKLLKTRHQSQESYREPPIIPSSAPNPPQKHSPKPQKTQSASSNIKIKQSRPHQAPIPNNAEQKA